MVAVRAADPAGDGGKPAEEGLAKESEGPDRQLSFHKLHPSLRKQNSGDAIAVAPDLPEVQEGENSS
ncbi:unnamed protein product [Lampetra planeri]